MKIAAGRLRVLVRVPFSVSLSPSPNERELLYDKARAIAERSLTERYPPKTVTRFGVKKVIPDDRWRTNGWLEYRVATMLAERDAVLRVLDGRRGWGSGTPIPRWRWRKRQLLTTALCEGHRIAKWW